MSINCRGGVAPTEFEANRKSDKLTTIIDWLEEGASFVCLQDLGTGCNQNEPPDTIASNISGHSIVCAGEENDPWGTVAVVVRSDWSVLRVLRVPGSSRCLGVEIQRGASKCLVVSVYLPPGMDAPLSMNARGTPSGRVAKNRKLRREAYRVLRCVREWVKEYECFFVCGDFNQDPPVTIESQNHKKTPVNRDPLSVALLRDDSPAIDVFKSLGVTRPTRKGGTRRIDYVLTHTEFLRTQIILPSNSSSQRR